MQSFTSSFFGRAVAVVIVLTCAPRAAPCQGQPILARLDGPSTVVLVDPVTSRERRLYDASPRGLRDLTVSPSERYVAVVHLNVADGPTASKGRPRNQLIVLAAEDGRATVVDRDVRRYVWCCNGETIAFVVGAYYEGGVGFLPEGVFLYDLATKSEAPLPLPKGSYALQWSAADSSLYAKALVRGDSARVWRYHVPTKEVSPTLLKDVLLSPSGRYYLYYNLHDLRDRVGWHLIERSSGRDLPLPDTTLGVVQGWAFGRDDYLLLARTRRSGPLPPRGQRQVVAADVQVVGYTVYDAAKRRVSLRIEGRLMPSSAASGGALPVVKGGRLELISQPSQ